MSTPDGVTEMLLRWNGGDRSALDGLTPILYGELRRLAASYLRSQRPDHTLQPTALVHEAYLKLVDHSKLEWKSRAHFFGMAATVMRHILVDHARAKGAAKRSGGPKVPLDEAIDYAPNRPGELIALDDALKALSEFDPRKARVVELRFFGGLTNEETAEVLEISVPTVVREMRMAQAWLHRELTNSAHA